MDELFDIPDEYLDPLVSCFNLLKECNITIFNEEKSFWKRYWRSFYIIPCTFLYHLALSTYMINIFNGNLGIDEMAYVVSVYVVTTQAILKAVYVVLKKKELKTLIVQLGRIWGDSDLTEVQINKKNAMLSRLKLCYTVFYWMNVIAAWQYMLAPLLETVIRKYILQQECGLLLPFRCSFPFDPSGNWLRYIGVYIFEIYTMFCVVYYFLGSEFLLITLCSHLATEFTILGEELLNNESNYGDGHEGNINGLKRIIRRHQKLIYFSDQLDNIFNRMIFLNLSAATISICFFAFSAKVAHTKLAMANNFIGFLACVIPIFNVCYYGEILREASENMANAAYNNLWYQAGTKYQKLLGLIILRAQKPCSLTSLKHSQIALNTFTAVLSTTWSYFSLASSLYEDES